MNNPNPFVPRGSLLELQSQRRSRLKLAVFCVLAVSVTGLTAMLIQGCKRTAPDTETPPAIDTNTFAMDTNFPSFNDVSNPPVVVPPLPTNPPVYTPPVMPVEPVVPTPAPTAGGEYTIVKGDTLAGVAKTHGVSLKSLQAANPNVIPTKLKIGQKIVIPAGESTSNTLAPAATLGNSSGTVYTVKSGDTLSKIAKLNHTTIKAIQAENGLVTTKIKVGQKLKIPSKAEPAVVAPVAPAPPAETMPAPVLPPVSVPPPTAPANGQ